MTQQPRDSLAQQLKDREAVWAARIAALDASVMVHHALTRQYESGESIRYARITALNTIQRDLHVEANWSASPSANRRAESAAGGTGRSLLKIQAWYTLLRQLHKRESARAPGITAFNPNRRARLALIQQFKDEDAIRDENTTTLNAIQGAEEDQVVGCGRHDDSRSAQGEAKQEFAEATEGEQRTEDSKYQEVGDLDNSVEELSPSRATTTSPGSLSGPQAPCPAGPGGAEATLSQAPPAGRVKPQHHPQLAHLVSSIIELAPHTDSDLSIKEMQHENSDMVTSLDQLTPRKRHP